MSVKRSGQARRMRRERRERQAASLKRMMSRTETKVETTTATDQPVGRCPDCGGLAVGKNGRWHCRRSRKRFASVLRFRPGERQGSPTRDRDSLHRTLVCGARGTIMPDGSLAVLAGGLKREEQDD